MNVTEREYSLTAAAKRGLVRDVKEKLRYFGADYDTVHKSTAEMDKEKIYEPPETSSTSAPIVFVARKCCSCLISLVKEPLESKPCCQMARPCSKGFLSA